MARAVPWTWKRPLLDWMGRDNTYFEIVGINYKDGAENARCFLNWLRLSVPRGPASMAMAGASSTGASMARRRRS